MRSLPSSFLRPILLRLPPRLPKRPPPSSPSPLAAAPFSSSLLAMSSAAVENEPVSPAKTFWRKSRKEAAFAAYSPFVVSLASGTLDVGVFRRYIAQDAHFLKAFARAYEMAEECVDDDGAKAVMGELRMAVLEELKMHGSVAEEWGIDMTKEITPNSATVKYTDFLQATTLGKVGVNAPSKIATSFGKTRIAAYTIGAMTPCMRLYAFLGQELKVFLDLNTNSHPFKQWIDNYSATAFEASALQIEELLDKLTVTLTGEELEIVEKLYNQAMRLEIEFFYAQPIVQQSAVPLVKLHEPEHHLTIFSDFDLTCTVVDSCGILAEVSISVATKDDQIDPVQQNARKSEADLRNSWNSLSSQYVEEYEQFMKDILMSEKAKEFDYKGLWKALEKLSEFEKLANLRVIQSGLLKGLKLDDIKREGERLILHDGCVDFFKKTVNKEKLNADLHILSFCWCGDLIRAAFAAGGVDVLSTHSNEFCYEGSISTGKVLKKMESPLDKIQAFKEILNSKSSAKTLSVYIGDSIGDLLCLLEADVGIVIGSSSSLRKVGAHFGVSFQPLFHGLVNKQRDLAAGRSPLWKGSSGTLYTASGWAEIHAFILGIEHIV